MPFECYSCPAVIKYKNDHAQNMIIVQHCQYFKLNVYNRDSRWGRERILWIGFYQNNNNDQCLTKILPKDVLKYILSFIGKQEMVDPYIALDI